MSKNSLYRQARKAYCQAELARILTLREDRFGRAFGMETVRNGKPPSAWRGSSGRPEDYYHFRDNGSRVLAVAHLDTVVRPDRRAPRFRTTEHGPLVVSGALDDRLGAYVILKMLPKLGITCDWLLTVGEESGCSTAEDFVPPKKYDHVIEFDRGGMDVVMYQFECAAGRAAVAAAGAQMGQGSFSDIAYLEHLGVQCFNWGVGYGGDYHSEKGYAFLRDTFSMVAKYLRFHDQNAGITMPHDARNSGYGYRDTYGYRDGDDCYTCEICGEDAVDSVTWYCRACGSCADCGLVKDDECMCYMPERLERTARNAVELTRTDEDAGADAAADSTVSGRPEDEPAPWQGMTWAEYLSTRPAPPGTQPRAAGDWHNAAPGGDGCLIMAHKPGQDWALDCLRCAARWPHPVAPPAMVPFQEPAGDAQVAAEDEDSGTADLSKAFRAGWATADAALARVQRDRDSHKASGPVTGAVTGHSIS